MSKLEKLKSNLRPKDEKRNISKDKGIQHISSNLSPSPITEEDMLETDERIIVGDTDTISQSHEVTANLKEQKKMVHIGRYNKIFVTKPTVGKLPWKGKNWQTGVERNVKMVNKQNNVPLSSLSNVIEMSIGRSRNKVSSSGVTSNTAHLKNSEKLELNSD